MLCWLTWKRFVLQRRSHSWSSYLLSIAVQRCPKEAWKQIYTDTAAYLSSYIPDTLSTSVFQCFSVSTSVLQCFLNASLTCCRKICYITQYLFRGMLQLCENHRITNHRNLENVVMKMNMGRSTRKYSDANLRDMEAEKKFPTQRIR